MFSRAIRILSIRGVDVRLDLSLVLLAVLVVWTFAVRFAAEHGLAVAIVMGIVGMVLFLASILAHEVAHALEALHRDLEVESITLLIFGGVTQMHAHSSRPRDEFVIAAVGPFVSLLAGAIFGLAGTVVGDLLPVFGDPAEQLLRLLAALNVLLAVFNLVPGAPLDGGRVLRAGLWAALGDRSRAIRVSARFGQALGLALAGYGLYVATTSPATIAALWLFAIGAFLFWAAGQEHRTSRLDDLYSGTRVRDILALGRQHPATEFPLGPLDGGDDGSDGARPRVDLDDDLHDLVAAFQGQHDAVVLTEGGRELGVVEERYVARAVALLRRGHRATTEVAEPAP